MVVGLLSLVIGRFVGFGVVLNPLEITVFWNFWAII